MPIDKDLSDIPPMIPELDDVDTHRSGRRAQGQDIVSASYAGAKYQSSTASGWLKGTLLIFFASLSCGGYLGYLAYEEASDGMETAKLRISDLERRLSFVGENAEESNLNLNERIDFNFTEIDKLWAARRVINGSLEDIQGGVARTELINGGQDESLTDLNKKLAQTSEEIVSFAASLNSAEIALSEVVLDVELLDESVNGLAKLRSDLELIRQSLNSGDSTVLGLAGRLEYMEESMESINAHRLQVNESLYRLQERLELIQRSVSVPAGI
jgi:septation ring formation regulator EzrA